MGLTRRIRSVATMLLFCASAYFIAPFSLGDARVLVPVNKQMDAVLGTQLVGGGIDKLQTAPAAFYDTGILYPDHAQIRTTEPFLTFAVAGWPLRTLFGLDDADVFDGLRWAVVFTSLVYAYLLFRALGVDAAVSMAGALLCAAQPDLLSGFERLAVVAIPLILGVLYHGLMVWTTGGVRHSLGLFALTAIYPLCGMINASICAGAAVFILPLLLKMLASGRRQGRLAALLLPLILAAVLDAVVLVPWLDRSDLAVYVSDAFLAIKHWNGMRVPLGVAGLPAFVVWRVGLGLAAALVLVCAFALRQRTDRAPKTGIQEPGLAPRTPWYLLIPCAAVVGLAASFHVGGAFYRWAQLLFQVLCAGTFLWYWRDQVRFVVSTDGAGPRNAVLLATAGTSLLTCLLAFGPVYVSNENLFANYVTTVLLDVMPPLKSIREFTRIWIPGILFLSVFAIVRLGMAVHLRAPIVRIAAAAFVAAGAMASVYNRPVVASSVIEAPRDVVALASRSRGTGPIYVHKQMLWNTALGVWLIPAARELERPFVNGYLGVEPPYFMYASSVLHRFPDPEALWLLRRWKVDTVLSLAGEASIEGIAEVEKVFESADGVVYDLGSRLPDVPHPSEGECAAAAGHARVDGEWSRADAAADGASVTVTAPQGFAARTMEIAFGMSVIDRVPQSIDVYARGEADGVRLNAGESGAWIESLAADALVHRRSPVATIGFSRSESGQFRVELRKSPSPPIERIALCGEWTR